MPATTSMLVLTMNLSGRAAYVSGLEAYSENMSQYSFHNSKRIYLPSYLIAIAGSDPIEVCTRQSLLS